MRISSKIHTQIRWQNASFIVLLIAVFGLLGFLSAQYNVTMDWSLNSRNTLSDTSIKLLDALDKPLSFTIYATEDESLRGPVTLLLERYQRHKSDIQVKFINPELEPVLIRELGINTNGEIVIEYGERTEHLLTLSEQDVSNVIQRLARSDQRWLVFLSGHGERDPHGQANHDLGAWVKQLETKGFKAIAHKLTEQPHIPDNTAVLVIAGPQVDLLEGEVKLIQQYVQSGGNLLWLSDPGSVHALEPIAKQLSIELHSGTVVDPTTQTFGINDPRVTLVSQYPLHPITQNFDVVTLYPQAHSIQLLESNYWQSNALLTSMDRSWLETGELKGNLNFDSASDKAGPLIIGAALTHNLPDTAANTPDIATSSGNINQQRVVFIGDGDFLSNAFLGNGGNLDLGISLINWLSKDDRFISIPNKTSTDTQLNFSTIQKYIIGFGFLFFVPVILIGCGIVIKLKRGKK